MAKYPGYLMWYTSERISTMNSVCPNCPKKPEKNAHSVIICKRKQMRVNIHRSIIETHNKNCRCLTHNAIVSFYLNFLGIWYNVDFVALVYSSYISHFNKANINKMKSTPYRKWTVSVISIGPKKRNPGQTNTAQKLEK